jgi:hypothetical protein
MADDRESPRTAAFVEQRVAAFESDLKKAP